MDLPAKQYTHHPQEIRQATRDLGESDPCDREVAERAGQEHELPHEEEH